MDGQDNSKHVTDGSEQERTLPRRGMIAGAIALTATALALDSAEPAAAHDAQDVFLGGANSIGTTTSITCTGNSSTALAVHGDVGSYSFGLVATGTAYGVSATGGAYAGVFGDTSGSSSVGVTGLARSTSGGYGVTGSNSSTQRGAGVLGSGPGIGVWGVAGQTGSVNFLERPATAVGVYGAATDTTGIGGLFEGGLTPLRLRPAADPGPPTSGAHEAGDLVVSSDGKLYFCRAAGTPGTWVELGAPAATPPPPPEVPKRSTLVLLPTPERFVDTRIGLGGVTGAVTAASTLTFTMTGRDGQAANAALRIPDNATAIIGNLTAVGGAVASPGAFLTLWPGGAQPTVSNLNYGPSLTIANSYVVGLAPQNGHGTVKVFNHSDCDYILDVSGYYVDM